MDTKEIQQALRALDGREIAKKLAAAAALPAQGVAAGQSVASVAMEALGIELARPINDVDVFLNYKLTPEITSRTEAGLGGGRRLVTLSNKVSSSSSGGLGGYMAMGRATPKEGYNLLLATREGMLNEIFYARSWGGARNLSETRLVINAFDLNCAQIGLDLKSGELAWTPAFEEFLASHQLRVMNVATPFHTAARYFKKKEQLGCYGDDELNMAACALPSVMGLFGGEGEIDGRSTSEYAVGRFGKKTKEQALSVEASLSPWFKLERPETRSEIWTMRPNWEANGAVFEKLRSAREGDRGVEQSPFLEMPSLLISQAANWAQGCLRPQAKGLDTQLSRLDEAMSKAGCAPEIRAFYGDIAKVEGADWARGKAASETELRALARLTKSHHRFAGIMWGMSLKEQASAALALKRLEQTRGQKLYGWLEGESEQSARELLRDSERLEAFCQNQSLAGERKLAEPLAFKGMESLARRAAKSLLRVQFEELLTPNALEREGNEMSHCVGGYASAIERGRSRIFKVAGPESADRSTLETGDRDEDGELSVAQHRAFANKDPSERAKTATLMLAAGFKATTRQTPALALAPTLARALDAQLVAPEKMRTAERLLRLAEREAAQKGLRNSAGMRLAQEALERHFPRPAQPASAEPAGLTDRLGLRRLASALTPGKRAKAKSPVER